VSRRGKTRSRCDPTARRRNVLRAEDALRRAEDVVKRAGDVVKRAGDVVKRAGDVKREGEMYSELRRP
jgi:hypothetical protein